MQVKDELNALLYKKLFWIKNQIETVSTNVSRYDLGGATRKEIAPFEQFLKKGKVEVVNKKDEIKREMEMLHLNKATINHEETVELIKAFRHFPKSVLAANF
jgi:hypothetical protein